VHRLAYNGDVVALKMGRRLRCSLDPYETRYGRSARALKNSQLTGGDVTTARAPKSPGRARLGRDAHAVITTPAGLPWGFFRSLCHKFSELKLCRFRFCSLLSYDTTKSGFTTCRFPFREYLPPDFQFDRGQTYDTGWIQWSMFSFGSLVDLNSLISALMPGDLAHYAPTFYYSLLVLRLSDVYA
jgi:hypothetical protein